MKAVGTWLSIEKPGGWAAGGTRKNSADPEPRYSYVLEMQEGELRCGTILTMTGEAFKAVSPASSS